MIDSLRSILACLLLGTILHSQEPSVPPKDNPRALEGWLIELLDRDPSRARAVYEAAAIAEQNSAEDQRIARTRLRELDRLASPGRELSARLERATGSGRSSGNTAGNQIDLRQEFARALSTSAGVERERMIKSLRDVISDPELQRPIQPRPYMQGTLRQLREARSTTLARLNTEIAQARAAGNREALRRLLSQRFRLRRPALPRERFDQINRRPLAVIAQRHLQGNTQAAKSMTRILRGRRFRGEGDLSTSPLPPGTEHRKLLTEARRRLGEFILDENLSAFELQVMERLAGNLARFDEQGREDEATALLARIPYYGKLFLR